MYRSSSPDLANQLTEETRRWLIDEAVGLIDHAALVTWVEGRVAALDTPPDALIAIAFGEPLDHVSRLDLLKDRITSADCPPLAHRILEAWRIDLQDVDAIALRLTRFIEVAEPHHGTLSQIDEDIHRVDSGILGPDEVSDEVERRPAALAGAVSQRPTAYSRRKGAAGKVPRMRLVDVKYSSSSSARATGSWAGWPSISA